MIHVAARLEDGRLELIVSGHAGAGEPGQDVVCAAVSAIVHTALLGLQAVAERHPEHVRVTITEEAHGHS